MNSSKHTEAVRTRWTVSACSRTSVLVRVKLFGRTIDLEGLTMLHAAARLARFVTVVGDRMADHALASNTMKTQLIERAASAAVAVAIACTPPLRAQTKGELSSPVRREECLQIERQVQAGSSDPLQLANLQHCDDTGPRVLVDRWRNPPTDYRMMVALMRSSSVLHDRRLLACLSAIAVDTAKPFFLRETAIVSMVSYFNPDYSPLLVQEPQVAGGLRVGVAMVDHPNVTVGAEPLRPSDLVALRQVLSSLAARDSRKSVRELASRVANTPMP